MRALVVLVLILALLGAGGYLAVRQLMPAAAPADAGPVYATVPVARGDVEVVVEGFGNLDPQFIRDIQSPTQGTLDQLPVTQNQRVRQGELLAVVRNDQLGFEVAQKRFELEQLRARLSQLLGVPPDQVTRVPATTELTLRAPAAGRVTDLQAAAGEGGARPLEPGMEIAENQRVATIVDDSRVVVVADLFPGEASRVEVGQEVLMAVEGFEGFVPARVVDVNRNPVPAGDHFVHRTTIEAANPGLLRPGQEVRLTFRTAQGEMHVNRPFRIERYGQQVAVYSTAKGTVVRVHVREGAQVSAGDPLVTLGGQLSADFLRGMQQQVRQLELELSQKQAIVENLEIRSPIDGVVAWINSQPGQVVQQGQSLMVIFDSRKMRMLLRIDELDVLHVREGMEAEVTVEALPGRSWKAKVVRIDQWGKNEQGIAQYGVMLEVDGTDELRPGMSASVRIPVGIARNALRVPVEAIFDTDDGGKAVEILVDGRPQTVKIEVGLVNDRWAEVKSGLQEGQQVVVGSSLERLEGMGGTPGGPLTLPGGPGQAPGTAPAQPTPAPAEPGKGGG